MYISKIISIALLASLTTAATTSSDACHQAESALNQVAQHYETLADAWNGKAGDAIKNAVNQLYVETAKIKEICTKLAAMESQGQSYADAESNISDKFS
ncbi:hypothetical protein ETB97_004371 [Aspergillus alliaceus]|uniref:Uncharacterized protein n=1 Tax=Petromyces alliaceus TaxID=209559 RepID=A0A8H6A2Z5_PETAA|nr:hypothetical protein ETB97_004371 [Aspergillus burnettii]